MRLSVPLFYDNLEVGLFLKGETYNDEPVLLNLQVKKSIILSLKSCSLVSDYYHRRHSATPLTAHNTNK